MKRDAGDFSILTIGHSTLTAEAFLALLAGNDVTAVVDVRTVPRSRHNPQFNQEVLPGLLSRNNIAYTHMPGLGGLRRPHPDSTNTGWRNASFRGYADYMQTEQFEQQMNQLIRVAGEGRPVLMCAEALPWRCHRSLISDALTVRGIRVGHIMARGAVKEHVLTPWARVEEGRIAYPGPE